MSILNLKGNLKCGWAGKILELVIMKGRLLNLKNILQNTKILLIVLDLIKWGKLQLLLLQIKQLNFFYC